MNESLEDFYARLVREGKYRDGNLTWKGRVWLQAFMAECALERRMKKWK